MIKTLNLTPNQLKTVYDVMSDRHRDTEDLIDFMKKESTTKQDDLIFVEDYKITLKLILSQVEKKL
jgi:hypothetical protein